MPRKRTGGVGGGWSFATGAGTVVVDRPGMVCARVFSACLLYNIIYIYSDPISMKHPNVT